MIRNLVGKSGRSYGSLSKALDELNMRQLFHQSSFKSAYIGIEPTSDSMHLGNLVSLMPMFHLARHGIKPILLLGTATGLVGDPSGTSSDRIAMERKVVERNAEKISAQVRNLFAKNGGMELKVVKNHEWYENINIISFLSEIGKLVRINPMLSKDSVKTRMDRCDGINFAEFSYQLLQGYDFYHLFKEFNCKIQIGGSDQWGNIVSGIDLAARKDGVELYGITVPLLTTSGGEKFGKSAGNAIWLDAEKTLPFELYQYLLNTPDDMVGLLLKRLTMTPVKRIEELLESHKIMPELYLAQKELASSVVQFIHGDEALKNCRRITEIIFGNGQLDVAFLKESFKNSKNHVRFTKQEVLLDRLAAIYQSKSEVKRLLKMEAITINGEKTSSLDSLESISLMKIGKRDFYIVERD